MEGAKYSSGYLPFTVNSLFSGAPTRASRQSPILIEYGQPLFVWLSSDWPSVRTYASTDCKGGVEETLNRKEGVSQACLGRSTSCILDSQNGQLTTVKTGYPLTIITWPYRWLMCQLIEVTWFIRNLSADQLIVLLDRDQCSISYFLASLRAQENW